MQRPIPIDLYELCMSSHQELEISGTFMPKRAEFLGRLHVDIEKLLLVTVLGFQYFFFIKDNVWNMIFMLPMKIRR